MAVMISKNKKDLIVSCKCGCDQGIYFRLEHFDDLDSMMYMSGGCGRILGLTSMPIQDVYDSLLDLDN